MQDLAVTPPLFKETVFDDPSVRDLSRVGVIDIGSNSVRLVVFDGAARSPAYFFNEKIMCGRGVGLSLHGRLNPEGRNRAISAIARFKQLAKSMGINELTAVATAAVRTASDGQDFCEEVKEKKDIEKIILCDVQKDIYPNIEASFLNLLHNSGYPEVKFEKKIDFEKLYNQRFN